MRNIFHPQLSFEGVVLDQRERSSARWSFLLQINTLIDWPILLEMVEPIYPQPGNGRKPYPMEPMLRVFLLRHWYKTTFAGIIDLLHDSDAARAFAGIDCWKAFPPGRATLQRFEDMLADRALDSRIHAEVTRQIAPLALQFGELREPKLK